MYCSYGISIGLTKLYESIFLLVIFHVSEVDLPGLEVAIIVAHLIATLKLTLPQYYFFLDTPAECYLVGISYILYLKISISTKLEAIF